MFAGIQTDKVFLLLFLQKKKNPLRVFCSAMRASTTCGSRSKPDRAVVTLESRLLNREDETPAFRRKN